jgi:hypothetical protein
VRTLTIALRFSEMYVRPTKGEILCWQETRPTAFGTILLGAIQVNSFPGKVHLQLARFVFLAACKRRHFRELVEELGESR